MRPASSSLQPKQQSTSLRSRCGTAHRQPFKEEGLCVLFVLVPSSLLAADSDGAWRQQDSRVLGNRNGSHCVLWGRRSWRSSGTMRKRSKRMGRARLKLKTRQPPRRYRQPQLESPPHPAGLFRASVAGCPSPNFFGRRGRPSRTNHKQVFDDDQLPLGRAAVQDLRCLRHLQQ